MIYALAAYQLVVLLSVTPKTACLLQTKAHTVENESTRFTGRVHSSGMESGRPRADFWCERTDAEYIRHNICTKALIMIVKGG